MTANYQPDTPSGIMQAALVGKDGVLRLAKVPPPSLRGGGAIVSVLATALPSYTADVFAAMTFHARVFPELPFIGGVSAVGRVLEVADNVFDVSPGQLVHIDPQVYSHSNNQVSPDNILQGWTGIGPGYQNVQRIWKDGPFAEKMSAPAECLTVIPEPCPFTPVQLSIMTGLSTSYAGLLKAGVRPGQSIIINGGTGQLGSLAVLLALATGVAKVVVTGRNQASLNKMHQLDLQRVVPACVAESQEEATRALRDALEGRAADAAIDFAGNAKSPDSLLACLANLKAKGILSLVGSLDVPLPLNTGVIRRSEIDIRGSFMYDRPVPRELIAMAQSGVLDLGKIQCHSYPLSDIHEAIKATKGVGALGVYIITPTTEG